MKYFFILMLLMACSAHKVSTKEKVRIRWAILENAINESWTSDKIIALLGKPTEIEFDKGSKSFYYESPENGFQEWSIGFKENVTTGISFQPTGIMRKEFALKKIRERWEKYNCVNKISDLYRKGHTIYRDEYYLCDGGKRIDYNRYKEVSWIRVKREN